MSKTKTITSTREVTFYECRARASVLRGRRVLRVRGWPMGRNANGLVEDMTGVKHVVCLRALRKVGA